MKATTSKTISNCNLLTPALQLTVPLSQLMLSISLCETLCLPKYTASLVAEEVPNPWTGCVGTVSSGQLQLTMKPKSLEYLPLAVAQLVNDKCASLYFPFWDGTVLVCHGIYIRTSVGTILQVLTVDNPCGRFAPWRGMPLIWECGCCPEATPAITGNEQNWSYRGKDNLTAPYCCQGATIRFILIPSVYLKRIDRIVVGSGSTGSHLLLCKHSIAKEPQEYGSPKKVAATDTLGSKRGSSCHQTKPLVPPSSS